MKTAVFTVAYANAEPFWGAFTESLRVQSEKNFELLVINDGLQSLSAIGQSRGLNLKTKNAHGTATSLRKLGIEWAAAEGFEIVIFADADDWFDSDRIRVTKSLLLSNDIVFNDLFLFGEGISVPHSAFTGRITPGQRVGEQDILTYNFLGLSNTGARLHKIAEKAKEIPNSVIAFDWALFAQCFASGMDALFTDVVRTHYRQHEKNVAGMLSAADEQIVRGANVKANHYSALTNLSSWYARQARDYKLLVDKLTSDQEFQKTYCSRIRGKMPRQPLWWEAIRLESELF